MSEHDDHDEQHELEKMLEAATAAEVPEGAQLNEEGVQLREAWLALGEALEAADVVVDSAALVAVLDRRAGRRRTIQRAAVALAASLLVAVTAVWYFSNSAPIDRIAERPPDNEPLMADEAPPEPFDELAWDDQLDWEIAMVAQAMYEIDNPLGRTERAVLNLWLQIDRLEREMAGEAL